MKIPKQRRGRFKRRDFFNYTKIGTAYKMITADEHMYSIKNLEDVSTTSDHIVFSYFSKLLYPFLDYSFDEMNEEVDKLYGEDRVTIDSLRLYIPRAITTVSGIETLVFQLENELQEESPQLSILAANLKPNHKEATRFLETYEFNQEGFVEIDIDGKKITETMPNFPINSKYNSMLPYEIRENDEYKFVYRLFLNNQTNQAVIITNKHDPYSVFSHLVMYLGILPHVSKQQEELIQHLLVTYMHETAAGVYEDQTLYENLTEDLKEDIHEIERRLAANVHDREYKAETIEAQIHRLSPHFESIDRRPYQKAKNKLEDIEESIETLAYRLRDLRARKRQAEKDLMYANIKKGDFRDELEYLLRSQEVINFNINDMKELEIFVYTDLNHYEHEYAEIFTDNPNNFMVFDEEDEYDSKALEIMKSLFVESDGSIKVGQSFKFVEDMTEVQFFSQTPLSLNKAEEYIHSHNKGFIPNLHLSEYSCPGENKAHIEAALSQNDLIRAVEITIGTIRDFNFTDGVVSSDLFRRIRVDLSNAQEQDYFKYIYAYETGEYYTPHQYYEKFLGGSKEDED